MNNIIINFSVKYNTDNELKIECSESENILDLKNKIINTLNLNIQYIDIEILNDIPIRCLGKFNLEKGILPRTFDNYSLDRWNLRDKVILLTYKEVSDNNIKKYNKPIKKKNSKEIYRPPSKLNNIESGEKYVKDYDINSNEDFPTL